jgi:hypothetical protein
MPSFGMTLRIALFLLCPAENYSGGLPLESDGSQDASDVGKIANSPRSTGYVYVIAQWRRPGVRKRGSATLKALCVGV